MIISHFHADRNFKLVSNDKPACMQQQVIVASRNPVKIEAARLGFEKMFPTGHFKFQGISVPSGVSEQPMSNRETLDGARNRAKNARDARPEADYWVGIEGGIEPTGEDMEAFAWIVILSKDLSGKARTSTFFLPPPVVQLIREGKELGEADDMVFGHSNSKQKNGAVGILTGNAMVRSTYYAEAVVLALIPFKHLDLYAGLE